ncbi:MAG: hypothetical protein COA52_03630 [Hyphomicrobiales bacterium]|nr:MAG: hypothetical protein COA52_03630 [Hyphomicrobiales bacterium]
MIVVVAAMQVMPPYLAVAKRIGRPHTTKPRDVWEAALSSASQMSNTRRFSPDVLLAEAHLPLHGKTCSFLNITSAQKHWILP